jgi:hypothetical protein
MAAPVAMNTPGATFDGHEAKINWVEPTTQNLQGGYANGTSPTDLDLKRIWQSIYPPEDW